MRIFYFSGTGNAKHVAEWFSDYANEKGVASEIIDISKMEKRSIVPIDGEMLGLISPTHGFNFPPIMINFIFRLPRTKFRNKVFIMNTRAGMKISKLFLPGLSGIALLLAALILLLKGYRIIGMRSIDLPSNWISLHPGLREKVVISMYEHYKHKTISIAGKILSGKKTYRALITLPIDLLISPIAIGYYFIGRFILSKTFYASASCDNCMLCINQCPVKAIKLVDKRPFWSYRCESCMRCMNNCPKRAIETGHGYFIGLFILIYPVAISYIYENIKGNKYIDITGRSFLNATLRFTFESIVLFIFLFFSYRIIHYLRRYKIFEWIIVYTSFTKFKFWRRYKPSNKIN
ncbi:MAG TPA: EFR1 family ferrodoxin [Bacteroidales bacterium]|nr:EFR1 family ferrodoxin [Bacteroidales bacterium]HPS18471.1 EFR1 family ferrodoxin [Bacteroidales bacterium]